MFKKRFACLVGAACLIANTGYAAGQNDDGSGAYWGAFGLGGFTDQSGVRQSPVRAQPPVGHTDTSGLSGGGGLWGGYNFGKDVPVSLEFGSSLRVRHDLDIKYFDGSNAQLGVKGNVTTLDFMASALYNINTGYKLTPYIGAGGGVVVLYSDNTEQLPLSTISSGSSTDVNPAWQLQAGLKYPIETNTTLRLDYRFIDMGRIETTRQPSGDKLSAHLASQDFRLGATWGF